MTQSDSTADRTPTDPAGPRGDRRAWQTPCLTAYGTISIRTRSTASDLTPPSPA